MAVLNAALPLLPGKSDVNLAFIDEISPGGPRRAEWEDHNKRYGITRQVVSHQKTPHGDFVVVFFEGDDPGAMMAGLANSDNEFDKYFASHIMEVHGIDVSKPPPGPPAEVVLEYNG